MSVKSDIPSELKPWFKVFDQLCYRHDYVTVFDDYLLMLMNWFANAQLKDQWLDRKKRYNEKELILFNELYKQLVFLMTKMIVKHEKKWYDPFGDMYQCLTSRGKSSKLGQYFTPDTVCNFMAQINVPKKGMEWLIGDPSCGSGRTLLAAHAINPMCHYVATDLDRMCVYMTTINMCLHNMSGVVIHGNSLSMEFYSYWMVSRVQLNETTFLPKIDIITEEQYLQWHQTKLFISKGINYKSTPDKYDFDEEEILKAAETVTFTNDECESPVISNDNGSDIQPIHNSHTDQLFQERTISNKKVSGREKKVGKIHKIIINPDPNQMSLF